MTGFGFWSGNFTMARSAVTSMPYRFVKSRSRIGTGQTAYVRLSEMNSTKPRSRATASNRAMVSRRQPIPDGDAERPEDRGAGRVGVDQVPIGVDRA